MGTKKVGKKKYRMRVLFKKVGRRWIRTKRKYWRRLGGRRRRRYRRRYSRRRYRRRRRGIFRWRWGKRTKKIGKRKYRMRVLFKKVGRRWMRTKRAYWRRYGRRNRRRRRYRRRYRNRKYRWFWSGRTKKTKRGLYRRRVLYKRVGRKWVKTKGSTGG